MGPSGPDPDPVWVPSSPQQEHGVLVGSLAAGRVQSSVDRFGNEVLLPALCGNSRRILKRRTGLFSMPSVHREVAALPSKRHRRKVGRRRPNAPFEQSSRPLENTTCDEAYETEQLHHELECHMTLRCADCYVRDVGLHEAVCLSPEELSLLLRLVDVQRRHHGAFRDKRGSGLARVLFA